MLSDDAVTWATAHPAHSAVHIAAAPAPAAVHVQSRIRRPHRRVRRRRANEGQARRLVVGQPAPARGYPRAAAPRGARDCGVCWPPGSSHPNVSRRDLPAPSPRYRTAYRLGPSTSECFPARTCSGDKMSIMTRGVGVVLSVDAATWAAHPAHSAVHIFAPGARSEAPAKMTDTSETRCWWSWRHWGRSSREHFVDTRAVFVRVCKCAREAAHATIAKNNNSTATLQRS